MDSAILTAVNSWSAAHPTAGLLFLIFQSEILKGALPMALFWALWFRPETGMQQQDTREKLVGTLLVMVMAIALARLLANELPFRPRPIAAEGVSIRPLAWFTPSGLGDWSSFPSDHAVMFFALAFSILRISRPVGLFLIFHAIVFVSLPRIAAGLHWPSDILAGAGIGMVLALALFTPFRRVVHWARVVPFFEARPSAGYALLFLATLEVADMFDTVRDTIETFFN